MSQKTDGEIEVGSYQVYYIGGQILWFVLGCFLWKPQATATIQWFSFFDRIFFTVDLRWGELHVRHRLMFSIHIKVEYIHCN